MHRFPTLLRSLATICRNRVVANGLREAGGFESGTRPAELQVRALAPAGVNLTAA